MHSHNIMLILIIKVPKGTAEIADREITFYTTG